MMMVTTRMIAATRHRGGSRGIVIIVVVVVVLLTIQRFVLWSSIVVARGVLLRLSVVGIVLCLLARLLALASLHPGLLQQPPLLCQTFALLPVLDLILPDQSHGRMAKYVLVFAEFAYPRLTWRVVEVGVLLLNATLAGSILVQL